MRIGSPLFFHWMNLEFLILSKAYVIIHYSHASRGTFIFCKAKIRTDYSQSMVCMHRLEFFLKITD
jgi:hypothetical protein